MTNGIASRDALVALARTDETIRAESLRHMDDMMAHLRASILEQLAMVDRSRVFVERS